MPKILPCLWFDGNAEEAARFYTSILKPSKIGAIHRCGKNGPGPAGSVLTIRFNLRGQEYLGLNGGPQYKFNEAVSFIVECETQKELDRLWAKLKAGGEEIHCGWLKDKYGLTWQIVPKALPQMVCDPDPERAKRVFDAMIQMKKLDIGVLKAAYGKPAKAVKKKKK